MKPNMHKLLDILLFLYPEIEDQGVINAEMFTDDIDESGGIVMGILPLWFPALGEPVAVESHCTCVLCAIERFTDERSFN